ncbi:TcpE family conjugal transfer membrane protein [Actinomadura bangladeshensis]|uniref:TcpE family conjugal transfer membrane protein n=1 Tax=Actinomadura bangladeshensis TaxID=453573 RepID=UPI0031CFAB83
MDLPTYTNIWRIEKRLYKLYDLRLPMPLPLVQIGVFLGVFVPWILLLRLVGIPFESPWHVLYIVPPGVLTWLATRPVIEGKRLTELLLSQTRYLAEPRTWCRLTPIREPREVVIVARVWRRAEAPAAMERAAVKAHRKRRREPAPTPLPARLPRPAAAAAPPPLVDYAAQTASAPPKPWRRTTRDISHEDDVLPFPATETERPPATPRLETPAGSGKRALASGVRRPGAPAEFWQAAPATRPDIPQQNPAAIRRAAEEIANAPTSPEPPTRPQTPPPSWAAPRTPGNPPALRATDGAAPSRNTETESNQPQQASAQPPTAQTSGSPSDVRVAGSAPASRAAETMPDRPQQTSAHPPAHPPAARTSGDSSDVRAAGSAASSRHPEIASDQRQQMGAGTPDRPSAPRVADGASVPGSDEASGRVPAASAERPAGAVPEREGLREPRVPTGDPSDEQVAGRDSEPAEGQSQQVSGRRPASPAEQSPGDPADVRVAGRASGSRGAETGAGHASGPRPAAPAQPAAPQTPGDSSGARGEVAAGERERVRGAASGEPGDRRVAGPPVPPPWAPPPATRPDVPMVPGAFGAQPPAPRREPPKPWSEGLSRPVRPAGEGAPAPVPAPAPPVEEQAPPREVRSQPASPVRPRPLPPPPAPPPSGPAITPPGPEHEVTTGGLRRLIHAVGGGHGEVDAEYQQRLQQPFHGTRHVVVLGCTGGAGQTVTALMLGHTFAQHNGEPVVAIDVNPGPGALARRTRSDTNETLTGLITRADQVGSLTAMRRYTSQAKSGLDVIAAGKNPLQALDDRDYALAIRTIDKFYSVTLLDAAAAVVARVLPYADQIVLVAPASADAPRAVAMTFEWLDGHGYEELRSRAVTVINGVSRRSMDDVEQAEAVARGRCRALVRIPWDDHLSMDRAPRNELKSLRTPTRRAYLALAGVVAGGFTVMPERYQELQQEQEATR